MSQIKQILQAYTEGVSKSMISKKTGVSRNTVKMRCIILMGYRKPLSHGQSSRAALMEIIEYLHGKYFTIITSQLPVR